MEPQFEFIKSIFTMGGPGVGLGFFMGWFFVSKKYIDLILVALNKSTEAITKLTAIVDERMPHA